MAHIHIVQAAFPFDPSHPFRPRKADLDDLLRFENMLGIDHVCLTAISIYGNDNALLLQRLRELNGEGRGVVSIDPESISDQDLDEMHSIGVRGVRLNLKSSATHLEAPALRLKLEQYANRIRRLNWSLNLHVGLYEIATIADSIPNLKIEIVLDHMATPDPTKPPTVQKGFSELMDLLHRKLVWVKLSGLYRFADLPDVDFYVKEVLRIAPTQVIWASDWPHTGGRERNPDGDRKRLQDYRRVDVPAFIERCLGWCDGDEDLMHKILIDNPRRLWQYNS